MNRWQHKFTEHLKRLVPENDADFLPYERRALKRTGRQAVLFPNAESNSAVYVLYFHFTVHTLQFIFCSSYFTVHTLSAVYVLQSYFIQFILCSLRSAFRIQLCSLHELILQSILCSLDSAEHISQLTISTLYFTTRSLHMSPPLPPHRIS